MEFEVEASSARFDPLDDRWLGQVGQLAADLHREGGTVTRRADPQPGRKGGLGAIVLSLGSAGAFTAAVEVIKAFVDRDPSRSVRLSWHADGRLESLEVAGRSLDDEMRQRVVRLLDDAAGRPGRSP